MLTTSPCVVITMGHKRPRHHQEGISSLTCFYLKPVGPEHLRDIILHDGLVLGLWVGLGLGSGLCQVRVGARVRVRVRVRVTVRVRVRVGVKFGISDCMMEMLGLRLGLGHILDRLFAFVLGGEVCVGEGKGIYLRPGVAIV